MSPSPLEVTPVFDSAKKLAENAAELERLHTAKPSQFTVGGRFEDGKLVGGITYDRKLSNLWGVTAYARAYWDDARVIPHNASMGAEISRKF